MGFTSSNSLKNGVVLVWNHGLWTVIDFQHVKPGKGGAFVRSKLKNIQNGKVVDNTFRAGEKLETARIERRTFQYLYTDDLGVHLMNTDDYSQVFVPADGIEGLDFVKEGGELDLLINADTEEKITAEVPAQVELVVVQTEPGVKGDTATGATKPAVLESGATVYVPLFINEGDKIRVNTQERSYLTRVSAG